MAGCFLQKFFKLTLILLFFQHFALHLIDSLCRNLKIHWASFRLRFHSLIFGEHSPLLINLGRYEYSLEIQWIDHDVKVINMYQSKSKHDLLSYLRIRFSLVKYGSRSSKALIVAHLFQVHDFKSYQVPHPRSAASFIFISILF